MTTDNTTDPWASADHDPLAAYWPLTPARNISAPTRSDDNAAYYSYTPDAPHYIEQTVQLYLRLADDGLGWIVDGASVDGHPLDSTHQDLRAHNGECVCGRPVECERTRDYADELALPTARELAKLIIDALP